MDFKFTKEEEAFRQEVREFMRKEWTLGYIDVEDPEAFDEARKPSRRRWPTAAGARCTGRRSTAARAPRT